MLMKKYLFNTIRPAGILSVNGLLAILLSGWPASAQIPGETNVNHWYNPTAPFDFSYRLSKKGDSLIVDFTVGNRRTVSLDSARYVIASSYGVLESSNYQQILPDHLVHSTNRSNQYAITVPVNPGRDRRYLFIFAYTNDIPYRYDVTLDREFPVTSLRLFNPDTGLPVTRKTIPAGTPIQIKNNNGGAGKLYAYRYRHDFSTSTPPMNKKVNVQKSITPDTLITLNSSGPVDLGQQGMYFVQEDTATLVGLTFHIYGSYFPRLVSAAALIEPLRYISTGQEMEELKAAEDPKKGLDNYWLNLTRSTERARMIIREYYRQVAYANAYFTSFKTGWKTSQGMIALLYGTPDQVYRNGNRERWVYDNKKNIVALEFQFVQVPNVLTPDYYELIRDERYEELWYRNIDLWRKGRKEI